MSTVIWLSILTVVVAGIFYDLCRTEKRLEKLRQDINNLTTYFEGLKNFTFVHTGRLEHPPKFKRGDKVLITHPMSHDPKEVSEVLGMKYKEMDDYLPTYTCVTDGGETREVFEKNLAWYVEQPEQEPKTKKK